MLYILMLTERGEGCDHMVGCGMKYEEHEFSDDPTEAIKEAIAYVREWHGSTSFCDIQLIPASEAIDLYAELREHDDAVKRAKEAEKAQSAEEAERAELTRLQEKYKDE